MKPPKKLLRIRSLCYKCDRFSECQKRARWIEEDDDYIPDDCNFKMETMLMWERSKDALSRYGYAREDDDA